MANNENTKKKGAAVDATTPDTTKRKAKFTDNSARNQRLKLLDWLFERGSVSTSEARENLDIMSPAPRVMELKRDGYIIVTVPDSWTSPHGINHKGIARYVLTKKQPADSEAVIAFTKLFNRAHALCVTFNRYEIMNDLPYMTESELVCLINFLTQLQDS